MKRKNLKNKFEKAVYLQLKKIANVQYEVDKLPYVLYRTYLPDFTLVIDGKKRYIETKGYFRPEDRAKLKAVKQMHPDADIRVLFYKYVKNNARWCDRNGFPWAVQTIPEDWLQ